MVYTRDNPSRRYAALMEQYRSLHAKGEVKLGLSPEKTYPGVSLLPHIATIKCLIEETGANTLLDYGSGKGIAYGLPSVDAPGVGNVGPLIDYWDVDCVTCYDPCYPIYARRPQEVFDAVVCTDVLEHCPEEDLDWIVTDLFSYARRFVFAAVACFPAMTHLPNGENAHCTVQTSEWWNERFLRIAQGCGIRWKVIAQEIVSDRNGKQIMRNTGFDGSG